MLLSDDFVEVSVTGRQVLWYQNKGYYIPTMPIQLWCKNKNGEKIKNGVENRIARSTKIFVKRSDLPPSSNMRLEFNCSECGSTFYTTWGAATKKKTTKCKSCALSNVKTTGCHSYWVDRLITNNPIASCDISGEDDKRFLVLHHLLNSSDGGENKESNYVILSSNYHMAFHVWNGGTNKKCTKKDYEIFKFLEISGLKPSDKRSQTDLLSSDWVVVSHEP